MAIWLKTDPQVLALDADVIRATEFARVVELAGALDAMHELVTATMYDATARAKALVETARLEADGLVDAARRKFSNSARLGYAAGQRKALADGHARYLARLRSEQDDLRTSAERLARIVVKAVEQVISESDRDALMRRIAQTLSRTIDDATHLMVVVPPADAERARRLFGELGRDAVPPLNVEVVVDDEAPDGTCLCDWDYGVIEADLGAQVAGLSLALSKAASSGALIDWPDDEGAAHGEPYGEPAVSGPDDHEED